jgi:S-DNA-T family DNA segregation ATPase FtsK/SpoIIIE
MALAGLGAVLWSAWPVLRGLARPWLADHDQEEAPPPAPTPPRAENKPQPRPEPEPKQTPAPAAKESTGPRIKPRSDASLPIESPRQDKLSFAGSRFRLPSLTLLQEPETPQNTEQEDSLRHNSRLLEKKLGDFGVKGRVEEVAPGRW